MSLQAVIALLLAGSPLKRAFGKWAGQGNLQLPTGEMRSTNNCRNGALLRCKAGRRRGYRDLMSVGR